MGPDPAVEDGDDDVLATDPLGVEVVESRESGIAVGRIGDHEGNLHVVDVDGVRQIGRRLEGEGADQTDGGGRRLEARHVVAHAQVAAVVGGTRQTAELREGRAVRRGLHRQEVIALEPRSPILEAQHGRRGRGEETDWRDMPIPVRAMRRRLPLRSETIEAPADA
jgi:hypothetical protein